MRPRRTRCRIGRAVTSLPLQLPRNPCPPRFVPMGLPALAIAQAPAKSFSSLEAAYPCQEPLPEAAGCCYQGF